MATASAIMPRSAATVTTTHCSVFAGCVALSMCSSSTGSHLLDDRESGIEVHRGKLAVARDAEGTFVTRLAAAVLRDLPRRARHASRRCASADAGVAVDAPVLGPLVAAVALGLGGPSPRGRRPVRGPVARGRGLAVWHAVQPFLAVSPSWQRRQPAIGGAVLALGALLVDDEVVTLDALHLEDRDVGAVRDLQVRPGRDGAKVTVARQARLVGRRPKSFRRARAETAATGRTRRPSSRR